MPAEVNWGDVDEGSVSSLNKTFTSTKQPAGYFLPISHIPSPITLP